MCFWRQRPDYGLKNIISAAEKYDGTVTIDYDEKMFCVDVMIYVGMRKAF